MKKNYLKLVLFSVVAMFLATSCLETEELDSVKKMREAKTDQLNAQTQTTLIKNRYDSLNYNLTLVLNESNNKYTIAQNAYKINYQFKLDSANACAFNA